MAGFPLLEFSLADGGASSLCVMLHFASVLLQVDRLTDQKRALVHFIYRYPGHPSLHLSHYHGLPYSGVLSYPRFHFDSPFLVFLDPLARFKSRWSSLRMIICPVVLFIPYKNDLSSI